MEILEQYDGVFGENFEDNKRVLGDISTITSKELKNKLAGFITKTKKRATRERLKMEADQRAREQEAAEEAEALEEVGDARNVEAVAKIAQPKASDVEASHTWSGQAWAAQKESAKAEETWVSKDVAAVSQSSATDPEAPREDAQDAATPVEPATDNTTS